jgi:hypothetical protein
VTCLTREADLRAERHAPSAENCQPRPRPESGLERSDKINGLQ